MSAPAVWIFAVWIVGGTFATLLTIGTVFAVYDWLAMRREGKAGHDA